MFAEEAASVGVTVRQLTILRVVAEHQSCNQADIVKFTGVDRSTITELVGRMVKNGLLSRRRDQRDARAYSITITQRGIQALDVAKLASTKAEQRFLESIPTHQRSDFVSGLKHTASEPNEV